MARMSSLSYVNSVCVEEVDNLVFLAPEMLPLLEDEDEDEVAFLTGSWKTLNPMAPLDEAAAFCPLFASSTPKGLRMEEVEVEMDTDTDTESILMGKQRIKA